MALWFSHWAPPEPSPQALPTPTNVPLATLRTNTIVRRLHFVWSQIESDDYATFIANLRFIGCPEATIRDIIVADVNQLFAKRRATEVITTTQEWWKTAPDPTVARAAADKIRALEQERRDLLTKLLGPEWESSDYPYPAPFTAIPLDGPLLGSLAPATRAAVQQIERSALNRLEAYLEEREQAGEQPDPAVLGRMRLETRQELAKLLTPDQLEEYLLRYANTAGQIRSDLRGFETSPEEFRKLFRTLDALEQQSLALADGNASDHARQLEAIERERQEALKQTLGNERYEQYKLQQDPLYRQARSIASQAGVADDKLVPLAAIVRLTQEEEQRIRSNTALSAEERLTQLESTRQAQRDSLRQLLGEEAYQRYLEKQSRLWENPLQ